MAKNINLSGDALPVAESKLLAADSSGTVGYVDGSDIAAAYQNLAGIGRVLASSANIVDVFIYDTSKDSDGGAWRKRCQNTSWYNETLNTATRGKTREFPAVALIVAETTKVTIYDATDPDYPMWMVFSGGTSDQPWNMLHAAGGSLVSAVYAMNSVLCVSNLYGGCISINFITEGARYYRVLSSVLTGSLYKGNVSSRNSALDYAGDYDSLSIVNRRCNDVAMTVLDDAPIDPSIGLPVPNIAVATDGDSVHGLSLITHDGNVYGLGADTSGTTFISVSFDGPRLTAVRDDGNVYVWDDVGAIAADGVAPDMAYSASTTPALLGTANESVTGKAVASSTGLAILKENPASPSDGMVVYITDSYNTGWMHGDIKGAFLADTVAETITSDDTEQDRSVNANHLQVVGELTKAPVATGAELVGYSGFNNVNHLKQPHNSDLDFGADDFYIMGWGKIGSVVDHRYIATIGAHDGSAYVGGGQVELRFNASGGKLSFVISDDNKTTFDVLSGDTENDNKGWVFFSAKRENGRLYLHLNGKPEKDIAVVNTGAIVNTQSELIVGTAITYIQSIIRDDSLALLRIGKGAPSDDQIKYIYDTEKKLFQENAKCTLQGSAPVVSLAYDEVTRKLTCVSSTGDISQFQDLLMVNGVSQVAQAPTTPWKVAAAHADRLLVADSARAYFKQPAYNLREELERKDEQFALASAPLVPITETGSAIESVTLPYGFYPVQLFDAGVMESFTVSFDGFRYTAVLGSASTGDVTVMARRVVQ